MLRELPMTPTATEKALQKHRPQQPIWQGAQPVGAWNFTVSPTYTSTSSSAANIVTGR